MGSLPATFAGDLPCADCQGIRHQLELFPDQAFFLRMTYLGKGENANFDDIGSWMVANDRRTLVLHGGREAPLRFAIKDANTLRKLDLEGREIASSLNYDLKRTQDLQPLEPRLLMRGMYKYFADAGRFTECLTRRNWPVAQEQDNAALESAYSKARRQPGEELLVNLEGRVAMRPKMEGEGQQPTLVVERFIGSLARGNLRGAVRHGAAGKHLLEADPSGRRPRSLWRPSNGNRISFSTRSLGASADRVAATD